MAGILVFCEKDDTAFELLSKGGQIKGGGRLAALVLGVAAEDRARQYFAYGADEVYLAKPDLFAQIQADVYADAVAQVATSYGFATVIVGSTRGAKKSPPWRRRKWAPGA
jgi:electron transfer flavoprotein alpha subunit